MQNTRKRVAIVNEKFKDEIDKRVGTSTKTQKIS